MNSTTTTTTVNEGQRASFTVDFKDAAGAPAFPTEAFVSIYSRLGKVDVRPEEPGPALIGSRLTVVVSEDENQIVPTVPANVPNDVLRIIVRTADDFITTHDYVLRRVRG